MDQDIERYSDLVAAYATEAGVKIFAAIAFWIIGRWLVGLVGRMLQAALGRQKVDPTLMRYIGSFVAVTLNIVLVVAILGYFGVQTTTLAALGAAVGIGIAIGGAMQPRRDKLQAIPNVLAEPAVEVEILEFNLVGPVLAVRPFCHTDHYWQVYFDGNRIIREALAEAGFPALMPAQLMLTRNA